ncbi:hypothetical protein EI067_30765 [Mycobacterium paragordonae]|uniref:glycoside hydrolase family 19 protein n=1 Tax=Mycobacterium paragordonae TaxID=1389713 RepID=UPI00105FE365|nr:hypothetical protein [Mycobacterium paragordonae]TDK85747.1 hypothetical protein EI067_30765 [Mycobacterium paragordonae]
MPTEDGWEPSPRIEPDSPLLVWRQVPGADVTMQVRDDDAGRLMLAYAADYHANVEPLVDRMTACYTPTNSVSTSNHLNATAMDFNWDYYPWKVRGNLTGDKLSRLRDLLAFYDPWMFWAGDWDDAYVDEMHHQMNYGSYELAQQGKLAAWVKENIRLDGFSTYKRGGGQPQPQPAPNSRAAAITALYDAVPVIDEGRAAQLIDPLMAGLRLAECNTVNRIAMALAQWGHESDGFATTEEYAKDGRYAPYIGRTWIQITWQANYAAFGRWAAQEGLIDDPNYFVDNPTALADLKWAGIGAAWYWTVARPTINSLCDNGDIVAVTQLINGGQNGITDRRNRYQQALSVGDRLLTLIASEPEEGPLMALSDDEQTELLTKVRYIFDQLGPKHPDWAAASSFGVDDNGDELTLRDGLAELKRKVDSPEVAIVSFQTEKP